MVTATDLEFTQTHVVPALAVQLTDRSAADPKSISEAMRKGYGLLMGFVQRHGLVMNGAPRAIYTSYDAGGTSFVMALPVASTPEPGVSEPPIFVDTIPASKAYRFTHRGPYANLPKTYSQIAAFMKERGWMQSEADWARYMPVWEEYPNDPTNTPPADLVTHIYLPVREQS